MIGSGSCTWFGSGGGDNPPSNMDEGISWGVFIKGVNFEDVVVVIVTPALFGAEIVVKEWRLTPC
jgi:hypothetical protein